MPKVVDRESRRGHVIEATMTVIARVGLDGATMRAIADEAGCTTGLVTHHFENRNDLIVAVLRHVHRRSADRMRHHLESETAPADALADIVLEALPLDEERTIEWKVWLAFWSAAVGDEALMVEHQQRYAEWRALVGQLVARGVTDGAFRPGLDVRSETERLMALIDGLALQSLLEPARLRPRRVRALVADALTSLQDTSALA